jgi:hypothetical protein
VQREGYDYVRLDGTTPQKHRQGLCDEFNSRPSIFLFLMSTVAGGLGLNLTAANKVVRVAAHVGWLVVSGGLGCWARLCAGTHVACVLALT